MKIFILLILLLSLLRTNNYGNLASTISTYSSINTAYVGKGFNNTGILIIANPAGIALSKNFEFTTIGMMMNYDRFIGCVNFSSSFENLFKIDFLGSLGITGIYEGVNNIEFRDENGSYIGTYNYSLYNFLFTYGIDFTKLVSFPLMLGVSGKYLTSSLSYINTYGYGIDIGIIMNPFISLSELGIGIGVVNAYSIMNYSTGYNEMLIPIININAFYSLLDDRLQLSLGIKSENRYNELLYFKWIDFNIGISYSIDSNLKIGIVGVLGNQFSISAIIYYGVGNFSKFGLNTGIDNLGYNTLLSLEIYNGTPKYIAKILDPEFQKKIEKERIENLEKEYFSKAMLYFSSKDYKNTKKFLEEVLKINPNNETDKSMLKKIEDLLSMEEE